MEYWSWRLVLQYALGLSVQRRWLTHEDGRRIRPESVLAHRSQSVRGGDLKMSYWLVPIVVMALAVLICDHFLGNPYEEDDEEPPPQDPESLLSRLRRNDIPDDPVHCDVDGWYFWDETWSDRDGPF